MEVADIARDRYSTFEADDLGTSPFSQEVKKFFLSEKFSVPTFVLYHGTSDPTAHLRHFIQRMSVWGDEVYLNYRVFFLQFGRPPPEVVLLALRRLHLKQAAAPKLLPGEVQAHRVIPKTDADLMALGHRLRRLETPLVGEPRWIPCVKSKVWPSSFFQRLWMQIPGITVTEPSSFICSYSPILGLQGVRLPRPTTW